MEEAKGEYNKCLEQIAQGKFDEDELFNQVKRCIMNAHRCVEHLEKDAAESEEADEAKQAAEAAKQKLSEMLQLGSEESKEQMCSFLMDYAVQRKAKTRIIAEVLVVMFAEPSLKECALKDEDRKREVFAQLRTAGILSKDDALKASISTVFGNDTEFRSCLAETNDQQDHLLKPSEGYPKERLPSPRGQPEGYRGRAPRLEGEIEVQWMWADAKFISQSVFGGLTKMNPLRWSKALFPDDLGEDLKKFLGDHPECADRPVRIAAAADKHKKKEFETPEQAITWCKQEKVLP